MMLQPYAKRPDWYVISPEQARSIGHSPGIQFDDRSGVWIGHRSQLPLLGATLGTFAHPRWEREGSPPFGDGVTQLRPHQLDGVRWMSARRGTLLADAMRVGKTPQVIALHEPDSGPLVVVGPLATKHVWLDWFARRWPTERSVSLTGREFDPDVTAPLIFLHYDIAVHWLSLGIRRRIGTLVFDEGHLLSNRKSRRTQGALVMAPQAERIIVATGTPLWNRPQGLYPLLNLTAPGAWGTYSDWTARYASGKPSAYGWSTGAASNVDEFQVRLKEIMLRRVWADIADNLTPTKRSLHRTELSLAKRQKLDVIAAALGSCTEHKTIIGHLARYRRLVGNDKAHDAGALAVATPGPVVVWIWHQSTADAVVETVAGRRPCWSITGKVVESKREDVLDEWRAVPDGILVMSLPIGQAGIDLSHAAQCIFAELDWTPAVIGQAEMRTFSPMRPDRVVYVVADHEIDERLAMVLAEKCEQSLLMGVPAADTAIDVIKRVLSGDVEADLDGLAARMLARVRAEGTTFV